MVTFFAANDAGKLMDFDVVIDAGPMILDLTTNKRVYDNANVVMAKFEHGIYQTDDEPVIEFLRAYNTGGKLSNGKRLNPTPFPKVTEHEPKKPNETVKEVVKEVIKEVEVTKEVIKEVEVTKQVIPKVVFSSMELESIVDLAKNELGISEFEAKDKKEAVKKLEQLGFVP